MVSPYPSPILILECNLRVLNATLSSLSISEGLPPLRTWELEPEPEPGLEFESTFEPRRTARRDGDGRPLDAVSVHLLDVCGGVDVLAHVAVGVYVMRRKSVCSSRWCVPNH